MFGSQKKRPLSTAEKVAKAAGASDVRGPAADFDLEDEGGLDALTRSRLWYLNQNRRLFKALTLVGLVLMVSVAGNLVQFVARPRPVYFAITPDLRILEMPPLSAPVVSDQALINWATETVTSALSLDFLQWRQKLMQVRQDFDPRGFESFVRSLQETGNLKKIEDERLSLSCVVTEASVITSSGVVAGVASWRLEIPVLISYQSSKGTVATQRLLAQVMVQRAETTVNPRGLMIKQIVLVKKG
jgi:intracellular multiplication protein IcmL